MIVARNLEALIQARDTNPAELARRAKINPTGVYDILSGKSRSPKVETLGKIAEALGVPVATLFEEANDAELRGEIVALFSQLPEVDRQRLVQIAQAWIGAAPA